MKTLSGIPKIRTIRCEQAMAWNGKPEASLLVGRGAGHQERLRSLVKSFLDILFYRTKTGVAVEKPPLLKKLHQPRGRKCPPKSRTSFIGHPSAMKFLRTSSV